MCTSKIHLLNQKQNFMALQLSLTKQSPMIAKQILNTLLYLSGLWALIQPSFPNISDTTAASVNKWMLFSLAAVRFTIQFFHWEDNKPDTDNPDKP